jgi:CheY-like chemotaxis protein
MNPKIAIVDDDTIFQFTTKVKIQKLGLASNIQIFNDGEEIMDYLIKVESIECPDIILLDINMPMMDGWDFLEEYKKHLGGSESKIKIYMLSSSINPVDVDKAKSNKLVDDYIIKPIKDEDLFRIFEKS